MLLIFKKVFFLVGLTLYVISANSQTVTSTRNGVWNDPTTWSGGFVPTSANATEIIIDHELDLPSLFSVSVYHLVVNGKLTLKTASTLNILLDAQLAIPDLQVAGILVCEESATLTGSSAVNTSFFSGSTYIHQQGPLGSIPYAAWDRNSTFIINGFKDSGYINIAHSDSWKQSFGNVVYDCPLQTIFVVDLNGYLRNIAGDFIVKNTNNKTLRLSTTQNPLINIGGSFIVQGPSEVWLNTSGTNAQVSVQQDFRYLSTSLGPSYVATRGVTIINVMGNMELNSPGPLRMASSSADSLGLRRATINLSGNLTIMTGVIIAPPLGSGSGRIMFNGTLVQNVGASPLGSSFQGNLDFNIAATSIVSLGNSALSNTTGSLQVYGTLQVGSIDPLGAIQLTNKGNILINGPRLYEQGSTIEYNATSTQRIGNGHPSSQNVDLIISNPTQTLLLQDLLCHDLTVKTGEFDAGNFNMTLTGNLTANAGATMDAKTLRLEGNQLQDIGAEELTIDDLHINKAGGTNVSISKTLNIRNLFQIESANTLLFSNGYLTLLSKSDGGAGTARLGPLPAGSRVEGSTRVERFMSAEGRLFRYISSPVANASVGSLMDDFAVTGKFVNPSNGGTIPSLYFYDESQSSLQSGWIPFPSSGLAESNFLEPGKGYCTLIRSGAGAVTWDVVGELNQGDIDIPLNFSNNSSPANGWNLVGNPYACTVDWDTDGPTAWTKQNISPIICIRDNGIGGWGMVRYWDGDNNYSDIPEGHIAAGQSFWIKSTGPNPVLIAREGIKVLSDAMFFRSTPSLIPSFALTLKQGDLCDKTYFKVRAGAKKTFDNWDAIKIDNDHFDIFTISADSFHLAINAQDSLPCGTKLIEVVMKDISKGIYKLQLDAKLDFGAYTYSWIDKFRGTETILTPGQEIDIEFDSEEVRLASNRFMLRLDEISLRDDLSISAPSSVCKDQNIPVEIGRTQNGVYYSVWDENGNQLADEVLGNGSNQIIDVLPDSISEGNHVLSVKARSSCSAATLSGLHSLIKEMPVFTVISGYACRGEIVTLATNSELDGLAFSWFETAESEDTIATTPFYTTPGLNKSKTYFVSASLPSGCTTPRYPAEAVVIQLDSADIIWKDSQTLESTNAACNKWYLDGVLIGTERMLGLDWSGVYVLVVDTVGCVSSDTIRFIRSGIPDFSSIDIYPNPVRDEFFIHPLDSPATMDIINAAGINVAGFQSVRVGTEEDARINIKALTAGTYFAMFRRGQKKKMIRLVKVE